MPKPGRLSISLAPRTGPGFLGQAPVPGSVTNVFSLRKRHFSQVEIDGPPQQLLLGFSKSPSQNRDKVSGG